MFQYSSYDELKILFLTAPKKLNQIMVTENFNILDIMLSLYFLR